MYWLSVERLENWNIDKDSGFTSLGISDKKVNLMSTVKKGDYIITYMPKKVCSFIDVRQITENGVFRSKERLPYQDPYFNFIKTKPVVILEPENAINFLKLRGMLSFLPLDKDCRQAFRHSIRRIEQTDGTKVLKALKKQFSKVSSESLDSSTKL